MNKMMIIAAVIISVFLFNFGISFETQASALSVQRRGIVHDADILTQELKEKEKFVKKDPVGINEAFNLLINQIRMLESYGGTKIELLFVTKGEKENLEDYFTDSTFRGVKILPILLKISKFSKETDLVSILNDIDVLEKQTDLKVSEITNENDILEVKGELYGI